LYLSIRAVILILFFFQWT